MMITACVHFTGFVQAKENSCSQESRQTIVLQRIFLKILQRKVAI